MKKLDEQEVFAGQKFTCKLLQNEEMNFTNGNSGTTIFYQIDNITNKTLNINVTEKYLITNQGEQRDEDCHYTGYIFENGKIIAKSHKVGSSIFYFSTCGKIVKGCKYLISLQDQSDLCEFNLMFEFDGSKWDIVNFDIESEDDTDTYDENKLISSNKLIDTKHLVKNTDIIESTFTSCNLQVLGIGYTVADFSFNTNIEISILNGNKLDRDVYLKVNFYDEDNEIICSSKCYIDKEDFAGYDTFVIESSDDDYDETKSLLYKIKKARIFAKMD